jgi:hypothetical protein
LQSSPSESSLHRWDVQEVLAFISANTPIHFSRPLGGVEMLRARWADQRYSATQSGHTHLYDDCDSMQPSFTAPSAVGQVKVVEGNNAARLVFSIRSDQAKGLQAIVVNVSDQAGQYTPKLFRLERSAIEVTKGHDSSGSEPGPEIRLASLSG